MRATGLPPHRPHLHCVGAGSGVVSREGGMRPALGPAPTLLQDRARRPPESLLRKTWPLPSPPLSPPRVPHSPPQAPRRAPCNLEEKRGRHRWASTAPSPSRADPVSGAEGNLGCGGKPWGLAEKCRARGASAWKPQAQPQGRTAAVGWHADLRARAEQRHVLRAEAAFRDGNGFREGPVGSGG